MYAGKIVEEGDAREVFAEPAHPYTRELLRSTISLDTTELHSIPGAPPNLIDPPTGLPLPSALPERDAGLRRAGARSRSALDGGRRVELLAARPGRARSRTAAREPLEREEIAVAEEA